MISKGVFVVVVLATLALLFGAVYEEQKEVGRQDLGKILEVHRTGGTGFEGAAFTEVITPSGSFVLLGLPAVQRDSSLTAVDYQSGTRRYIVVSPKEKP